MAAKHILSLEIPTVANCEIFTIWDTSQYSSVVPVDCSELLVIPPGFNSPKLIEIKENFKMDFNACAFGLQTVQCNTTRSSFPDGIYVIRYRVQPHDKSYVEYNHLRITTILQMYYKKLCDLDIKPCDPSSDRKSLIDQMEFIKTLIDAAKAKVEYCHSPSEGMELYNFALRKLQKITCDPNCCN